MVTPLLFTPVAIMLSLFKVERGSVAAAMGAENTDGRRIEVYYFYKSSVAKYCFENNLDDIVALSFTSTKENYFLRGNRLYYDSTSTDFFKEAEENANNNNNNGNGGSNNNNPGGDQSGVLTDDEVYAVLSADYDKIRDHGGYQINLEFGSSSVYLDSYCQSLGIDRDDLYGITSIENNIGNMVYIYYFKSNALATKWCGQIWSSDDAYKVMGIRVICDYNNTGIEDIIK